MRYHTIWFRSGKAYVPTIGSPPSGMFFELDPVEAIEPGEGQVERAVQAALLRPAVAIKERSRFDDDWPKHSVVQVAAGYKSWKSFVRNAPHLAASVARGMARRGR
jgi:hypothetical protein